MEELHRREGMIRAVQGLRKDLDQVIADADPDSIEEPGSFEAWSFKDMIAHLTGWRLVTALRLEAGLHHHEPQFPWPDRFDEETDTDEINEWFFEGSRDKPLQQVIRESNATFDRVEHAIATMTEEDLFESGRFDWIFWTDEGLGPAVVRGAWDHYHIDHEPEILAWLARNRAAGADS